MIKLGLGFGLNSGSPAIIASYDSDAELYFDAMVSPPDNTRLSLLNDFFVDLKNDTSAVATLDWFVFLASHDAATGRLNAFNVAKSLSLIASPTFTVDRGYTGNAVDAALDWGELPNAVGNNYALNSACLGVWCNQQSGVAGQAWHIGTASGSTVAYIRPSNNSNNTFTLNDATAGNLGASTGSRTGHRTSSRTGAAIKRGFIAGVRTANLTTASTAVPTGNLNALRLNATYSGDRLAVVYSGGGLTDAEVASLHTHLNTYLTAIGAN